jgi:hypothetical protein
MKKLEIKKLEKISGGDSCFWIGLGLFAFASLGPGLLGYSIRSGCWSMG